MRARILTLTVMVGVIVALGFPRNSLALSLVPPSLEFSTQAGQTVTGKIKIFNDDKDFKTYFLSTANFVAGDENGQPKFDFAAPITDLASWIKTDAQQVDLQPGAVATVGVTIEVPKNADPGGHYAGIFVSTTPPGEGNVKVVQKTGTLVILRVEGNVQESAVVKQFTTSDGKTVVNRLPVGLVLRVQNTGNVHFRPKGTITIRNMWGGVTSTIDINPKEGAVLPNSIRHFDLVWTKNSTDLKRGSVLSEITSEWNNFAFGGYTAELNATYGSSNQTLTGTLHLTVFPWLIILIIVLLLIAIIFLIGWMIKGYNAGIIKRAQASVGTTSEKRPPQK